MIRLPVAAIILLFALSAFGQSRSEKDGRQLNEAAIKVTLLGTGDPQPIIERFGPSILVQAGGQNLLFDAGRGCFFTKT